VTRNPWTDATARQAARDIQRAAAPPDPAEGALYRSTYNPEIVCRVEWYSREDGRRGWLMVNVATGGTRHRFTNDADGARDFAARYEPAAPGSSGQQRGNPDE
jgi:hypothetical protein